jgi:hypothetical protein
MSVQGKFLCVIGFLLILLLASAGACFAWGGFPPRLNTHAFLTRSSLEGIAREAGQIATHADGPDFHRLICIMCHKICMLCEETRNREICMSCAGCKTHKAVRDLCPLGGACPADPKNTNCGDTHGHRITEFMKPTPDEEGRYGRQGAEQGAVYWARRAWGAYRSTDKREHARWVQYLGWATHYLADALTPPHCRNQDFWEARELFIKREDLFESGFEILDWGERFFQELQRACRTFRFLQDTEPCTRLERREVLLKLFQEQISWAWLRNYRGWLRNPDQFVAPGEELRELTPDAIRNWIVARARDIEQITALRIREAQQRGEQLSWPYLPQGDMQKVFAWISIGIRGLYRYVTTGITTNNPPIAKADAQPLIVLVNSVVQLDGSGSSDPDGDKLTCSWRFISKPRGSTARLSRSIIRDCTNPSSPKPTFKADKTGDYVLELRVNDGRGGTATGQVKIQCIPSLEEVLKQFWIYVRNTNVAKGWDWVIMPDGRRINVTPGKYMVIQEVEQGKRWKIGFEDLTEELSSDYPPDFDYDDPLLGVEFRGAGELAIKGLRFEGIYKHDLHANEGSTSISTLSRSGAMMVR